MVRFDVNQLSVEEWRSFGLGVRTDTQIAPQLGVCSGTVAYHRRRLGIAAAPFRHDWATDPRTYSMPAKELAAAVGVSVRTVEGVQRRLLGRVIGAPEYVDWDAEPLLGKVPDTVLRLKYGLANNACVQAARRRRGIPAFNGRMLTQEGLPCRSTQEAMVDAWLHANGHDHAHEVSSVEACIADIVWADGFIEVCGMVGHPRYDARVAVKRDLYARHQLPVWWIDSATARALWRQSGLPLRVADARRCRQCGARDRRICLNLCQRCYTALCEQRDGHDQRCERCRRTFRRRRVRRYCSQDCARIARRGRPARRSEITWPPDGELRALLCRSERLTHAAAQLGVKPHTLASYVNRRFATEDLALIRACRSLRQNGHPQAAEDLLLRAEGERPL